MKFFIKIRFAKKTKKQKLFFKKKSIFARLINNRSNLLTKNLFIMKKTLFILGFILSVAFLNAQTGILSLTETSERAPTKTLLHHKAATQDAAKGESIILWDNTNINIPTSGNNLMVSCYWSGNDNWALCADDFDADGPWIIEKINSRGRLSTDSDSTDRMSIAIYENDEECKPGLCIYRNDTIMVTDISNPEIILPEPFTLPGAGKYWVSIAGAFDATVSTNPAISKYRWNIFYGTTPKECNFRFYDKLNLFSAGAAIWLDAYNLVGAYSIYFQIVGDPNIPIDCAPVTNMTVEYDPDACGFAEITWEAPAEEQLTYIVYRDGDEIATVETESYTDNGFEPTLSHFWEVKVLCDGYTPPARVNKSACKKPDCPHRVKTFSVTYNQNPESCEAVLKWFAPTDTLYTNVNSSSNSGYPSVRYLGEDEGAQRDIMADDFTVPKDETWYITEVSFAGFWNADGQDYVAPDYFGVEIYEDSGDDLPGSLYYEKYFLVPESGNMDAYSQTILLPDVVEVYEGTYWLSVYGVYDDVADPNRQYVLALSRDNVDALFAFLDEAKSPEWEPLESPHGFKSIFFRIQGYKQLETILYNIYRDGLLIAEGVTETTFTDTEFDPTENHTWSVKIACSGGGESAPVYLLIPFCMDSIPTIDPGSITETETAAFSLYPNPSSNSITISAESNFNTVQVINFLGQSVIMQYLDGNTTKLDVSNLTNGVYFVRVFSQNGTSSVRKFVKQ